MVAAGPGTGKGTGPTRYSVVLFQATGSPADSESETVRLGVQWWYHQ